METLTLFADPNVEERKKILMRTVHNFWNDPGHGWLEVNRSDLKLLEIDKQITGYSYQKDDKVYLEEDCDLATYLYALFPDLKAHPDCNPPMEFSYFRNNCMRDCYREHIFIRSLPHYKA